jgi:hypothetical protein
LRLDQTWTRKNLELNSYWKYQLVGWWMTIYRILRAERMYFHVLYWHFI